MAAYAEDMGWCDSCGAVRKLRRRKMSGAAHGANILLSIATAGIWLLVYQRAWRMTRNRPWRCAVCASEGYPGWDHLPSRAELSGEYDCTTCGGTGGCRVCGGSGDGPHGLTCTACTDGSCPVCGGRGFIQH